VLPVIGVSLKEVITSPGLSPAVSAAPPSVTSLISAPTVSLVSLVASLTVAPSSPWVALPSAMISSATRLARFEGMAKPTPIEPDWVPAPEPPALAIATLTPMSSPCELTSAPPELPGLIAASVCTTGIEIVADWVVVASGSCPKFQKSNGPVSPLPSSLLPSSPLPSCSDVSSGTADDAIWMLRFNALTMPSVTVLARPSGAPIATTWSPTLSSPESANSMGVRPDASSSLITARSTIGSTPTIWPV
jgi:hypothetical protein